MANNVVCKSLGIGTIKIKMFDGMIRTITDVRYVPSMTKSLISLGQLAKLGCKISM